MLLRHLKPCCRPLLPLLLSLSCGLSQALPSDREQPINIEADRAEQVSQEQGLKTDYYGKVVMTQGSMRLTGNHVTIYSQDNTVQKVISRGEPARFQQQTEADKAPVKAAGKRLEYNLSSQTITAIDEASIIQDGSTVHGQRIDYDINTEQVKADSKRGSRVQMILQPSQSDSSKQ